MQRVGQAALIHVNAGFEFVCAKQPSTGRRANKWPQAKHALATRTTYPAVPPLRTQGLAHSTVSTLVSPATEQAQEFFFLNNAVSITYGDNDEVSLAFDNNGLNFVAGQNDDVYLAYDGPESVIDIGKGTAVDILANSGPLYLYDFQNDPTAEIILPPGTDTSPILFVGLQATGADMAVSATGAYTLQMFNGTTLVDLVQISEPGTTPPSFGLLPTGQGVYLTQGPLPGSLSVPLVYNLGAGETLSLNGNQLYGDAVILADSNVGDLDTEAVNVTGTVTFSDMHVATDSLHFFGGTLDFTGVSNFGGNEFTTGYTVFNDNLAGTGTLNVDGGNHDGGAMEINGSVTSGLTFDINPGVYAPTASLQIDDPATFHALIALPVTPYTVAFIAFLGLHATSANLSNDMLQMFNGNELVDTVRLTGGQGLQLEQNSSGVMLTAGTDMYQPGGPGTIIPLHIS